MSACFPIYRVPLCQCLLLLCSLAAMKVEAQITLQRPVVTHGVEGQVYDMQKDAQGLLWFAADQGLFSFDGSATNHYSDTITEELTKILSLEIDNSRPEIWLGCEQGVRVFDLKTRNFTPGIYLSGHKVNVLTTDQQGELLAGTDRHGLWRYSPQQDTFMQILQPEDTSAADRSRLWANSVMDIAEDPRRPGSLWLATLAGLCRWDDQGLKRYRGKPLVELQLRYGEQAERLPLHSLVVHPRQGVFVAGWSGVFRLEPGGQELDLLNGGELPFAAETPFWPAMEVVMDPDGKLWISFVDKGVAVYDPEQDRYTHFYNNKNHGQHLVKYIEPNGRLWSVSQGIKCYNPVQQQAHFFTIRNPDTIPCDYGFNYLYWHEQWNCLTAVTALGDGVHRFYPVAQNWQTDPLPREAFSRKLQKYELRDQLVSERYGVLILGVDRIYQQSRPGDPVRLFSWQIDKPGIHYSTLAEDDQHRLWLGTYGGELYRIDTLGRVEDLTEALLFSRSDHPGWVDDLHTDNAGRIWIRRTKGLAVYLPEEDRFLLHSLEGLGYGYRFVEDNYGRTWITGLNGGVGMTDPDRLEEGIVKVWELPGFHLEYGVSDSRGRLWFSLREGGLACLDVDRFTHQYFHNDYGLPHRSAMAVTPGDTLYMGVHRRIARIHLPSLYRNREIPKPLLSQVKVMGEEFSSQVDSSVTLPHDRNFLEFTLSSIAYNFPDQVRFSARLQGMDADWVDLGEKKYLNYAGISPGSYTLWARATNNEGLSSAARALFSFRIRPPWWRSWWFLSLSALALAVLVWQWYRYQLQRRLALAEAERMRELDAFRSRMLGNVTHEFRTPLTVIGGLAERMRKKGALPPKAQEQLETIGRQNRKLLRLVNQLIELSRLDRKELKVQKVEVELLSLLNHCLEGFQPLAQRKEIRLVTEFPAGAIFLHTDPGKLRQIVDNLLSNAVKFAPAGGKVVLRVEPQRDKLQISVCDNGPGIPQKDLPRIFERFYQSQFGTFAAYEGTGIGLSIVREYTGLLGGEIRVSSWEGKGARFDLLLPGPYQLKHATAAEKATGTSPHPFGEPPPENDERPLPRLLIVEDNQALRKLLALQLGARYRLFFAADGRRGLEKAARLMPDLILLDWMMPEMEGLEMCRQLKSDLLTCHIPIIMLTAKVLQAEKLAGIRQGADAYMTKPHDREELLVRIDALLENQRRLQEKYAAFAPLLQKPAAHPDEQFLHDISRLLMENLDAEHFSIDWLAQELHLSRSAFDRKVKALTGKTAALYLRGLRLRHARRLIFETRESISGIAWRCGYSSASHFSQDFRKEFGESPSELRKKEK